MASPSLVVCPAGASPLDVPGPVFGFVPLDLDTTATWSDSGSTAMPLVLSKITSTDQAFVSLHFTSTIAVRIMIARTPAELLALPDAPNLAQTTNQSSNVVVTNTPSVTVPAGVTVSNVVGNEVPTVQVGATNTKQTQGTATAAPTVISGALSGGSGACIGINIANTGANALNVIVATITIDVIPAGTGRFYPMDPNSITTIAVTAATSDTFGAIAYYN